MLSERPVIQLFLGVALTLSLALDTLDAQLADGEARDPQLIDLTAA